MSAREDSEGRSPAATSTETRDTTALVSLPVPRTPGPDRQKVPDYLTSAAKVKPPTSKFLETQNFHAKDNGFYFQSKAEADLSMAEAQWYPPANDRSIPRTDSEDRRVVGQLVSAAKNMSRAKDTLASAYRKKTSAYPEWAMEACAWDVLFIAKAIHMDGFRAPLYDAPLMDAIGETRLWTFQNRIDWVCEALMTSKNVVVNLMKKEKLLTIVGAPQKLYTATLVNTRSNACRGIWVKNGREADEEHQARPKKRKVDEKTPEGPSSTASSTAAGAVTGSGNKLADEHFANRMGSTATAYVPSRSYNPAVPVTASQDAADVDMPDAPNQPIMSFELSALNHAVSGGRFTDKKQSGDNNKIKVEGHDSHGHGLGLGGRNTDDTTRMAADASVQSEARHHNQHMQKPAAHSTGIFTPMDTKYAAELHNAEEINAAHALASLQQSSSP